MCCTFGTPSEVSSKAKATTTTWLSHIALGISLCMRPNRRTQRPKLEALIGVPVCRPRYRTLVDRALRDDVMFNENDVLLRSEKAIRCRHFRLSDCQSQNFRRFFGFVMAYWHDFGTTSETSQWPIRPPDTRASPDAPIVGSPRFYMRLRPHRSRLAHSEPASLLTACGGDARE